MVERDAQGPTRPGHQGPAAGAAAARAVAAGYMLRRIVKGIFGTVIALACALATLSCSGGANASTPTVGRDAFVSRPAPNSRVLLVPNLFAGAAGWCMATASNTLTGGSASCGGSRTSTGPIFAESCTGNETVAHVYALTRDEVAAVSVDGGNPIRTAPNSTLPDGLHAVAIELLGQKLSPQNCPKLTPIDANGSPIHRRGKSGTPLVQLLPFRQWEEPSHPPRGVCRLVANRVPREFVAANGSVVLQARRLPGLLGRAFLACVDTTFIYRNENHLRAAVLLNASDPGATPPPLPGIRPIAGHGKIFEAPGSQGEMVARRIPGGWLVVEESDKIGVAAPIELLQYLTATIHL